MDKNLRAQYKNSGIYMITCSVNNKIYIGSSSDMYSRYKQHKTALLNDKHCNSHMQRAFNKYGRESFTFKKLLNKVPNDQLLIMEREQILKYNSIDNTIGYNQVLPEANGKRRQFSEEIREKTRRTMLARYGVITDEEYQMWKDNKDAEHVRKELNPMLLTGITVLNAKTNIKITEYKTLIGGARDLDVDENKVRAMVNKTKINGGVPRKHKGYIFVKTSEYNPLKDYRVKGNPNQQKPFYQFSLEGVFIREWTKASLLEAGLDYDRIRHMPGEKRAYNGALWSRSSVINTEDFNMINITSVAEASRASAIRSRKYDVLAYDLDDNFIAEYNLPIEASESLGVRYGSILKVLSGKRNMTHGYKFMKRLLKPI